MSGRYRREVSVLLAFGALLLLLLWRAPGFFGAVPLRDLVVRNAPVLVLTVGMTLVILCRQIDLSIGSQMGACGIAAGLLAKAGVPLPLVAAGTVGAGGLLGAANGVLVAGLGLPSIVATLATLAIIRETIRYSREGAFVDGLPGSFQWLGLGQTTGQTAVVAAALMVFLVAAWALRSVAAGRAVYATGSDPEAARLAGLRPRLVTFGTFALMGALAGLAALLTVVQLPSVDPRTGSGVEMQVIASAVVGGVAISGGRGTLVGALVGVALLGSISSALVFLGTRPEWEKAIQGTIILLAVASDGLGRPAGRR